MDVIFQDGPDGLDPLHQRGLTLDPLLRPLLHVGDGCDAAPRLGSQGCAEEFNLSFLNFEI